MASNVSSFDSIIEQTLLICKHCQHLIRNPKSLPCLDVFCTTCLQTLTQGKETFNCPQCGKSTAVPPGGVALFPDASNIIALNEYVQLYIQNNPMFPCFYKRNEVGHQEAAVKCMECDVYYCNTCNSQHKLAKVGANHTTVYLKDLKEVDFVKAAQKKVCSCEKHPDSPLQYFCLGQACQLVICQRCTTVQHQNHPCVELERKAKEYRTRYIQALNESMVKQQKKLEKLKVEIQAALKKNEENHEKNMKLIKEKTQEMKEMLEKEEKVLLEEERKHTNEIRNYYTKVEEQVKDMSISLIHAKKLLQNLTLFSPNDELVKLSGEIQKKITTALQESISPELWIHSVLVISGGQPLVKRKQEIRKSKPMHCQHAFDGAVDSLAVFEEMTIAIQYLNTPISSAVYVNGPDETKAKAVKERIMKHCPQAYRVVPIVKDGHKKMVIASRKGGAGHDIKILSLDGDDVEDLGIDVSHKPYAITVDDKNNVLYTSRGKTKAIRKRTGHKIKTVFSNQIWNEVLTSPWYMASNINGDIIVSDHDKKSLLIFDENGKLTKTCHLDFTPHDVCTCPEGWIYVSDRQNDRIWLYDKAGVSMGHSINRTSGLSQPISLQWYQGILVVGQADGQIKFFDLKKRNASKLP